MSMPDLSIDQVHKMAKAAGLELDDARATTIASRLSAVRAELDSIPSESLMAVEPASSFTLSREESPPAE
jgi:ribosomal protein L12E/L44/L45/RPP1/RPP2|tara:strand:+ start:4866 stop:5075 length:210 start_codon:yes stop_codon:yes gene_type:complete